MLSMITFAQSKIGAFDGAIRPDIRQFSELPRWLDSHKEVTAGKTVLLYCTGGIRCERAAGLLEKRGHATRTLQLAGGIHRYLESYPDGGELWQGANLVFDQRHVQASRSRGSSSAFVTDRTHILR